MFPLIIALHRTFKCKMFLKFAFLGTNASDWSHFTGFWTASTLSVPLWKSPRRANTTSIRILQKVLITVARYIGQGILKRINSDFLTFPLLLLVQIFQIHCRWPNELTELDWNDELNFFEIFKIICQGILY